jgi:phage baseplate assembly protein W
MASIFGTDLGDLEQGDVLVAGQTNLRDALVRRLQTPRGGLWYDPDYGLDLREFVQRHWDDAAQYEMQILTQAECEKDLRVQRAEVTVERLEQGRLEYRIAIQTFEGPFDFVVSVDQLEVSLVYGTAL